ncbi:hypothetical protein EC968_002361 [Mortierella alpina]|nr:hypothetical protein EC968_002361 [Mortierella alpina]
MHADSTTVCQDLDDLLLQYLALVDEHLAACTRISGRFQEGRELISQAKYIMGPNNVSADCYDHRMKALRGIEVKGPTEIEISDLLALRQQQAREAQERELEQETEMNTSGENSVDGSLGQDRSGLRRRTGGGGGLDSGSTSMPPFENADDHQDKKEKAGMMAVAAASPGSSGSTASTSAAAEVTQKKKKERNPDPLLWFGVFVPASLRSAQSVFQKSLQDVVDLAIIRQRLHQLETRIQLLQLDKAKETLHQQIPDVGALTLESSQQDEA